jgi:hypothetical protein
MIDFSHLPLAEPPAIILLVIKRIFISYSDQIIFDNRMGGEMAEKIKNSYELAMERLTKKDPAMASKELPVEIKNKIAEIRRIYQARIAERKIMNQSELAKLQNHVPPEEYATKREEMERNYLDETRDLERRMEEEIRLAREPSIS